MEGVQLLDLEEEDHGEHFFVEGETPVLETVRAIPYEIRKGLRSLHLVGIKEENVLEGSFDPNEPLLPSLSYLKLEHMGLLPLLAQTAQTLVLSMRGTIAAGSRQLNELLGMFERKQLDAVSSVRLVIAEGDSYREQESNDDPEPEHTPVLWRNLEETYEKYTKEMRQRQIRVGPELELWVLRKRALFRIMELSERENESDEEEEESGARTAEGAVNTMQELEQTEAAGRE